MKVDELWKMTQNDEKMEQHEKWKNNEKNE